MLGAWFILSKKLLSYECKVKTDKIMEYRQSGNMKKKYYGQKKLPSDINKDAYYPGSVRSVMR